MANQIMGNPALIAFDPNESCSISPDALSFQELAAQNDLTQTHCGHKFSKIALNNWLSGHSDCPVCRSHLTAEQLTDLIVGVNAVAQANIPDAPKPVPVPLPVPAPIPAPVDAPQPGLIVRDIADINGQLSPEDALNAAIAASLQADANAVAAVAAPVDIAPPGGAPIGDAPVEDAAPVLQMPIPVPVPVPAPVIAPAPIAITPPAVDIHAISIAQFMRRRRGL